MDCVEEVLFLHILEGTKNVLDNTAGNFYYDDWETRNHIPLLWMVRNYVPIDTFQKVLVKFPGILFDDDFENRKVGI